ncbi:MAG TPA: hypothetical protein VK889_06095 [Solirubrobacterales bacterium]|nr:hypothetical protein [Solirubrobacterales bacterium]
MFDSKTNFTGRLTDAVDLMIDFATLGEYGLEPVGRTRQGCASPVPTPPVAATRAATRSSYCSLLAESGLCKPPSPRVAELQSIRKSRGSGRGLARSRGVRAASDPA